MEADARPPQKLSHAGNWNIFKTEFKNYMKITKGFEKPEEEQVAWLMNFMGPIGLKALGKITFNDPEDEKKLSIVLEKLDNYFNPPKKEIEERYKFFSKLRKGNESIDTFIRDLTEISKTCNFGEQTENLIRDVIIQNIKDKILRDVLFTEENLTLEKLTIMCKTYEVSSRKIDQVSKELMSMKTENVQKPVNSSTTRRPRSTSRRPPFIKKGPQKEFTKACWKCGQVHLLGSCPAFKVQCVYCNQPNHFSHCCPIAKIDGVKITPKNIVGKEVEFQKEEFEIIESKSQEKIENLLSYSSDGRKSVPCRTSTKNSGPKPTAPISSLMDLTFDEVPPSYNSLYPNLSQEITAAVSSCEKNHRGPGKKSSHSSHKQEMKTKNDDPDCTIQ